MQDFEPLQPATSIEQIKPGFGLANRYLLAWFAACLVLIGITLHNDYQRINDEFNRLNADLVDHITDRALVAETSLEGFNAFVSNMGRLNYRAAADYAEALLKRYPYLYMFEVAERVDHAQREPDNARGSHKNL